MFYIICRYEGYKMNRVNLDNIHVSCKICGKLNEYVSYAEEIGTVERHYFCDNCGYFVEQSYSPVMEGIVLGDKKLQNRRMQYKNKIKELNLEIYDI